MNKMLVTVLVVFLSISSLITTLPRHINPYEAPEELPSAIELLIIYSSIANVARHGNFTLALEKIRGLDQIYVPESIRYIFSRFNELLDKEIRILNHTKVSLDSAESALSRGLLENARRELRRASSLLAEAELIYNDISESCKEFSRAFGIPLTQLSEKIVALKELIEEYRMRLRDLLLELERLEGLIVLDTILTLKANASEAFVGSGLFIFGALIAEDGSPLSGKIVTVYLDGQKAATFTTNELGLFSGIIKIPYIYKPVVPIFAEYIPAIEDRGRFRGSRSNIIMLRLIYEVPVIIAWLNISEVRPSESFEIHGRITNVRSMIKTVYVNFLSVDFNVDVLEGGTFKAILRVPDDAPVGHHKIIVYTKPQGVVAPASKLLEIRIYKVNTSLIVETPRIVLGCYQMQIRGKIIAGDLNASTPISGIVILEAFDRVLRAVTSDSDFSFNVSIPCYASSGHTKVRVTYIPNTPIYEPGDVIEEVLVINLLTVLLPAPIVIYLAIIGIGSLMRRMEVEGAAVPKITIAERPEAKNVLISEMDVIEITRMYLNAVRAIEEFVGIKRRPSDTIREFLDKSGVLLGKAALAFGELSYMTEATLYGGIEPDLELARQLYDQILRWLV